MSENTLKTIVTSLIIVGVVILALIFASDSGWMTPAYRGWLRNMMAVVILAAVGVRYVQDKENRPRYRAYAMWAIVISVPMVTMGFLRDSWQNPWFQSTLFPAAFGPVMIATFLGYAALAFLFFRSMKRAK